MSKGKKYTPTEDVTDEDIIETADSLESDNFSVDLTEEEKVKLEAEARAEVLKHMKLSESKRFKAAAKARIQAEMLFRTAKDASGQGVVTVDLLLASHPKYIMLDGAVYHSGKKHTVSRPVAAVLLDQMHRGWEQEYARLSSDERGNLRRQRNFVLKQNSEGNFGLTQVA